MCGFLTNLTQSPPEGYPEYIEAPSYFLQALDTPVWLWIIRIALVAGFLVLMFGIWYCGRHTPERELSSDREKEAAK